MTLIAGVPKVLNSSDALTVGSLKFHKIWCLCSEGVTCEVHPIAQIDVVSDTVGQFSSHYFAENGCRIPIIRNFSINGGVKRFVIPSDAWVCGLPFIESIQAPTVSHGWGVFNTSNQNWPVILGVPYSKVAVT